MQTLEIETLKLESGSHSSPDRGMCVMEAVAYFAGEPHSDAPGCVCKTIREFLMSWNDTSTDDARQDLKRYIPLVVGTNHGPELALKRSYMVADWYARVYLPAWLRCGGVALDQAAALEALPECDNAETLGATTAPVLTARAAARAAAGDAAWAAAGAAARAAARAAAGDAAWAAARAAAGDAAWAAAGAAAWAAAGDAAWAAARDAATKRLQPTRDTLRASAFDLLDRLIALQP